MKLPQRSAFHCSQDKQVYRNRVSVLRTSLQSAPQDTATMAGVDTCQKACWNLIGVVSDAAGPDQAGAQLQKPCTHRIQASFGVAAVASSHRHRLPSS